MARRKGDARSRGRGPTRRELLRGIGAAALVLPFAAACSSSGGGGGGANVETESSAGSILKSTARLPAPFQVPLPVPAVLRPVQSDAGGDRYQITQRVARVQILPGTTTEIWGFEGTWPGPTIVSRRGRPAIVEHRNELPVPTVVHLHGGRTPAGDDGYPADLVLPVQGWQHQTDGRSGRVRQGVAQYTYPLDQPAATLWYHDHRMDFTGPQVYRGLAGFHLVHDDEEDALPLPRDERDIPLMIADRSFGQDGSFLYPSLDPSLAGKPGVRSEFMSGVLGDCILVNGAPWPELEVTATRYRFRVLNASNARRYRLALDPAPRNGPAFVQVGSDAGLLAAPMRQARLEIAQAQRYDVVVDFSGYRDGERVTMVNELGSGGTARVMRFVVARRAPDDSSIPSRLVEVPRLSPSDARVQREITFQRGGAQRNGTDEWTVNNKAFDPGRIDADPALNSIERWKIKAVNVPHPIHVHLAHFQVVQRDGSSPGLYDAGWKDTVNLDSGGQADILLDFEGYRGKYVFHCHNLEHEDMAMMGNFQVR